MGKATPGVHGMLIEKRPARKKQHDCKTCRFAKLSQHRSELYGSQYGVFKKASASTDCKKYSKH